MPIQPRTCMGTRLLVSAGESMTPFVAAGAPSAPVPGGGGGAAATARGTLGGTYGRRVTMDSSRRTSTRPARTRRRSGIPSSAVASTRMIVNPAGWSSRQGRSPLCRDSTVTVWPRARQVVAIRYVRESNSPVVGSTSTRCCGTTDSDGRAPGATTPGATPVQSRSVAHAMSLAIESVAPSVSIVCCRARRAASAGARSGGANRSSASRASVASVPTRTEVAASPSVVSSHSVELRNTRHGVPSQAASRWTPPESVTHGRGVELRGQRAAVAERLDDDDVRARLEAERVDRGARPRMQGEHDRAIGTGQRLQQPDPAADRVRRTVLGSMDRREQELAGPQPAAGHTRQRRRLAHLGQGPRRQVAHDVADEVDTIGQALGREVLHGGIGRGEAPARQVVHDDPVDLLRHPAVERAQAGLDVGHRHVHLGRHERRRQRRVRVAVDHDRIGRDVAQCALQRDQHPARLLGAGPTADAQRHVRRPQPELAKEAAGHRLVPVLPGVDEDLVVPLAQRRLEGRGLDELRPGADHVRQSHVRRRNRRREAPASRRSRPRSGRPRDRPTTAVAARPAARVRRGSPARPAPPRRARPAGSCRA